MKNGVYFIVIALLVAELFKIKVLNNLATKSAITVKYTPFFITLKALSNKIIKKFRVMGTLSIVQVHFQHSRFMSFSVWMKHYSIIIRGIVQIENYVVTAFKPCVD